MRPMMHRFSNGLTLIHRRNRSNEIVSVVCLAKPGAAVDPDSKSGRTHLMVRVLSKGTQTRSSDEIAEALEGMGVRFGTADNHDYVSASFQSIRSDMDAAFEIYADIIRNPSFPLEEIEAEKERVLAQIRMREDRPPSAAMKRFREALLEPGPYGRALEGEPQSVVMMNQTDLFECHAANFAPPNMVVSIVGDLSFEEAKALVEKYLGGMKGAETPSALSNVTYPPRTRREDFTRQVEQGFVVMGSLTCPIDDEDVPAVEIASAVLGQGMSSRLFRELRDRRGLGYIVGSYTGTYRGVGFMAVYLGTSPGTVRESIANHGSGDPLVEREVLGEMEWAAKSLWDEVEVLQAEPVSEDELDRAKSYLVGSYLRGHESNARQAHYLAYWELMGLGIEYDQQYPDELRAVTSRDVMRVANKYFNDPTSVILVPAAAEEARAETGQRAGE